MTLPQDYDNYTKISWVDSAGIKHLLYPTSKTSNPTNPLQNSDGDFISKAIGTLVSTSSSVALDDEYKDIQVGMVVSGPYIPIGTIVSATSNSGGITTISMEDTGGTEVFPTDGTNVISNAGTTLSFTSPPLFSLALSKESSYIVENLSWNLTDYKITGTASELTDLEIGMLVSHDNFTAGTVITNIFSTTIVVSNLPDTAVASGGEITFTSPDSFSDTWSSYKSGTPSENQDDYQDDTYWPMDGERYGLDPQHSQANGTYYIDPITGLIHFGSNISGKILC